MYVLWLFSWSILGPAIGTDAERDGKAKQDSLWLKKTMKTFRYSELEISSHFHSHSAFKINWDILNDGNWTSCFFLLNIQFSFCFKWFPPCITNLKPDILCIENIVHFPLWIVAEVVFIHESFSDVPESWVLLRADLKRVFWTFSYLYLWHTMWFHAKKVLKTLNR